MIEIFVPLVVQFGAQPPANAAAVIFIPQNPTNLFLRMVQQHKMVHFSQIVVPLSAVKNFFKKFQKTY